MVENDRSGRDPMLEMFIFESVQLVEQLEALLLDIEQVGCLTQEAVNGIFRIMHTIKGSAGMMAYDEISRLAHALEDLFDSIRTHPLVPVDCSRLNDHVLQGTDFIKAEVAKIESGMASDGNAGELIRQIGRFRETLVDMAGSYAAPMPVLHPGPTPLPEPPAGMDSPAPRRYAARIFFEDGCQMENLRAYTVIHELRPLTVDLACRPADIADNEQSADTIRESGFQIYMTSCAEPDALMECLERTMFLERLEMEPVDRFPAGILDGTAGAGGPESPAASLDRRPEATGPGALAVKAVPAAVPERPADTMPAMGDAFPEQALRQAQGKQQSLLSVSIQKLDQLVDLVGELVISEAMVTKNPDLAGLQLPHFEKAARQLHKLTNELQDIVMSIRMVPIASTFHKMQRLVRDVSRKLGKDVALTLAGEDTEVDKRIIDSLSEPLMHLIRNALDHGIESAAERAACGKPAQGNLSLEARAAGGDVWITIRDDGRGLDRGRILQKARERHLFNRPESECTDKDIFSLILLPGFSTREEVSEFSGRGVGMDVVRESLARIGGTLGIDSAAGTGTNIFVRIPLTLAIIDGMQIAVGESSYIIPITAIRESFRIAGQPMVVDMDGNEMLMIRGTCCNVIRLHRRFNVATAVVEPAQGIMVVVEDGDRSCCLFADRLVGEQQVVVKPLPAYIQKAPGLAGCTILGDGSISLILDIGALVHT